MEELQWIGRAALHYLGWTIQIAIWLAIPIGLWCVIDEREE